MSPVGNTPSGAADASAKRVIEWRAVEALTAAFLTLLSVVAIVFAGRMASWPVVVGVNACVVAFIGVVAWGAHRSHNKVIHLLYDWYPAPMIFLVFKEVYFLILNLQMADMDHILIALDRAVFGGDPTVWFHQYATPFLTELLQLAYASYFIIMVGVGVEVYARNEMKRFDYYLFLLSFGFFTSYIGYLLFPGVGPRFTLHDFHAIDTDLPGLWLTGPIRAFLNAGESIPAGAMDAMHFAQRDVFPSGHTELTLISVFLAFQWRLKIRWYVLVAGVLLIISTVYLRYHYVVDVAAGAVLAAVCIWIAPRLYRWWQGIGVQE